MLQRVQAEVGELGDLLVRGPDSEDTTGVLGTPVLRIKIMIQQSIGTRHCLILIQLRKMRRQPTERSHPEGSLHVNLTDAMKTKRSGLTSVIAGWASFTGNNPSKLVDLAITNVANVTLVVAIALLFAADGLVLGVIGAVVTLGGLLLIVRLMRHETGRKRSVLAVFQPQRLLLLIAVAGGYTLRRPDDTGWIWVATALALLAVLTESAVRVMAGRTRSMATQLPGVPTVRKQPFSSNRVAWATLVVASIGGLLAIFGAPGWCYLLLVLVGATPMVILGRFMIRAVSLSRQVASGVRGALETYAPEFTVYYASKVGATYQLGMWLPYLERLGRPFVVITVNASTVNEIAKLTSAPILVPRARTGSGRLAHLVVPSMKAAFYVQNHVGNLAFQRFSKLTHIWLNHGDSDKAANFSAQHATFDKVFVSGQQGVDRYAAHGVKISPEQFAIVGRPQIEKIEVRDQPLPEGSHRTVLYAPTWAGGQPATNYSSLPVGAEIVAALLDRGVTVIFRPHPHSYRDPEQTGVVRQIKRRLSEDQKSSGRAHVFGKAAERDWDIPDCFNRSDALITDVSSVASDYLASGKPLAMVAIRQTTTAAFRRDTPMARVAYVVEPSLATLDSVLDDLLGSDPLAQARHTYRTQCLGSEVGEHAADAFLATARSIIARA